MSGYSLCFHSCIFLSVLAVYYIDNLIYGLQFPIWQREPKTRYHLHERSRIRNGEKLSTFSSSSVYLPSSNLSTYPTSDPSLFTSPSISPSERSISKNESLTSSMFVSPSSNPNQRPTSLLSKPSPNTSFIATSQPSQRPTFSKKITSWIITNSSRNESASNLPSSLLEPQSALVQKANEVIRIHICKRNYFRTLQRIPPNEEMPVPDFGQWETAFKYIHHSQQQSDRQIIFGVGPGTTGTHGLAGSLLELGKNTIHWKYDIVSKEAETWKNTLMRGVFGDFQSISECNQYFNELDFRFPLDYIDALTDVPIGDFFFDLYLTYPNAKFILTTRDPETWFHKRHWNHKNSPACLLRPCGIKLKHLPKQANQEIFRARQEFVRCIVPQERLLEICVVCGNVTYGMIADFIGVDVASVGLKSSHLISQYPWILPWNHSMIRNAMKNE